jgi:hypothetical protein
MAVELKSGAALFTCPCNQVQISLDGQPAVKFACFCDDCYTMNRICEGKARAQGQKVHSCFNAEGGTPIALWNSGQLTVNQGQDQLGLFRAARKRGGTVDASRTSHSLKVYCKACNTQVFQLPGELPGFVGMSAMPDRWSGGGCLTDLEAKHMKGCCSITKVPPPSDASSGPAPLLVWRVVFGRMLGGPLRRCTGSLEKSAVASSEAFWKTPPPGADEHCGKPIEYFTLETMPPFEGLLPCKQATAPTSAEIEHRGAEEAHRSTK